MGTRSSLIVLVMTLFVSSQTHLVADPMGTAFTYQGRIMDGGSPADDTYDLQFMLYDALTSGTQQGSAVEKNDVDVNDGYFTVTLDFGDAVFNGDARWVQIGVRPGESTGAYTTLTPRHELTPSVYALRTAGIAVSNGNVGIGTSTPVSRLSVVDSSLPALSIYNSADNQFEGGRIRFLEVPANTFLGGYLHYDGSNNVFNIGVHNVADQLTSHDTNAISILRGSGNIGIGTSDPSCDLDVQGGTHSQVRTYGPGNPYFAAVSSDNDVFTKLQSVGGTLRGVVGTNSNHEFWVYTNNTPRMVFDTSGKVGIGMSVPTQRLDVNGNVRCVDVLETSDEQLKTDVRPLGGVLEKLDQVRAVSFRWNEKAQSLGARSGERQIGVLAQELEQIFPELVTTPEPVAAAELLGTYPEEGRTPELKEQIERDVNNSQYKAVCYSKLTVVLLKAIKELQEETRTLQAENESLRRRVEAVEQLTRQLNR